MKNINDYVAAAALLVPSDFDDDAAKSLKNIFAELLEAQDINRTEIFVPPSHVNALDAGAMNWVQYNPQPQEPIIAPLVITERDGQYIASMGRWYDLRRSASQWIESCHAKPFRRVDWEQVRPIFDTQSTFQMNRDQKLALGWSLERPLAILTGGPGTGKTTTISRWLAAQCLLNPTLAVEDICLLAPTGKAASRMTESLQKAIQSLKNVLTESSIQMLQQVRAQTIHRALGWTRASVEQGGPWRHHAQNPLGASLVIVDEASMIDLSLFSAMTSAISETAQVVLMGDRHQLEAVELGGVLAEQLERAAYGKHSASAIETYAKRVGIATTDDLRCHVREEAVTKPLHGLAFCLYESRRYSQDSVIGKADKILRDAMESTTPDWSSSLALLQDVLPVETAEVFDISAYIAQAKQDVSIVDSSSSVSELHAFVQHSAILSEWVMLCALRQGMYGSEAWNARFIQSWQEGLAEGELPHGYPIMITRNDAASNLSNGDVGIALAPLHSNTHAAATHAVFPASWQSGGVVVLPLAFLTGYEPALAITIHKSQGSEWQRVHLAVPAHLSVNPQAEDAFLTPRLLYTGLTRAKQELSLVLIES